MPPLSPTPGSAAPSSPPSPTHRTGLALFLSETVATAGWPPTSTVCGVIKVPEFARLATELNGPLGTAWVESLPGIVPDLIGRWDCVPDGDVVHGGVGLIVPVRYHGIHSGCGIAQRYSRCRRRIPVMSTSLTHSRRGRGTEPSGCTNETTRGTRCCWNARPRRPWPAWTAPRTSRVCWGSSVGDWQFPRLRTCPGCGTELRNGKSSCGPMTPNWSSGALRARGGGTGLSTEATFTLRAVIGNGIQPFHPESRVFPDPGRRARSARSTGT